VIPSNWRDLTATLVFKDNWPQRNAMFCDGLAGLKSLVSQSHSCAVFPGCGISFCDGFVNSAKPFSGNNQMKVCAHGRMPPLRVCLAPSDVSLACEPRVRA